ncbi:hypothetical protein [Melissospora conviva]|uniref:hypothetical protein n=1 Tax=Melissospora conviva TaxID=3388432 RepID=UPI003C222ACC
MSTNYYLRTADTPDGDEGIHLGQYAAGQFTFRAYPDRGITTYKAWLAQLKPSQIFTESGSPVAVEVMARIASASTGRASWAQCGAAHSGGAGFFDEDGRRWLAVEFC